MITPERAATASGSISGAAIGIPCAPPRMRGASTDYAQDRHFCLCLTTLTRCAGCGKFMASHQGGANDRGELIMPATFTTAELADAIGTDPRTLRKFLRATTDKSDQPGKGARYTLPADKRSIAALAKKYAKWDEARKAEKADKAPTTPEPTTTPVEDNTPEGDDATE